MTSDSAMSVVYPRRQPLRLVLRYMARGALSVLADVHVSGRENLPDEGPMIVVANHFSFVDPALMISLVPWPIEFLGGLVMPDAPSTVTWLPKIWGYFPVKRGSVGSRTALRKAEAVLKQKGFIGIYPEAGTWAGVLRPPRPGTAFLAARTGARLLPMGFYGLRGMFKRLGRGQRPQVEARIGKPFGPFSTTGHGRERRRQLDEIGHEIMARIAELLPAHKRGYYSADPKIREAAMEVADFPWHELEG